MTDEKEFVVTPECKAAIDKALAGSSFVQRAENELTMAKGLNTRVIEKEIDLEAVKGAVTEAVMDSNPSCTPADLGDIRASTGPHPKVNVNTGQTR